MMFYAVLCVAVAIVAGAPEAPYPPRGWRPSGEQFNLPSRQQQQYGAPPQEYGPAETTTEVPTTTEQASESVPTPNRFTFQSNQASTSSRYTQGSGQYFIITPEGGIQHIAIPAAEENRRNPEPASEAVPATGGSSAALGQLVRLPVRTHSRTQGTQLTGVTGQPNRAGRTETPAYTAALRQPSQESTQLFALTTDGRLQPVDAAAFAAQKQLDATQAAAVSPSALILSPDGRFQRIQVQPEQQFQVLPQAQAQREENGRYNIILPSGKLQRVQYMNVLSPENRLTSNVQYMEVNPLNGPLYTFGAPLSRVA